MPEPLIENDDGWDFKILIVDDEWVLRHSARRAGRGEAGQGGRAAAGAGTVASGRNTALRARLDGSALRGLPTDPRRATAGRGSERRARFSGDPIPLRYPSRRRTTGSRRGANKPTCSAESCFPC
jgi:hypothetical protein